MLKPRIRAPNVILRLTVKGGRSEKKSFSNAENRSLGAKLLLKKKKIGVGLFGTEGTREKTEKAGKGAGTVRGGEIWLETKRKEEVGKDSGGGGSSPIDHGEKSNGGLKKEKQKLPQ